jgi:hypothetical protein
MQHTKQLTGNDNEPLPSQEENNNESAMQRQADLLSILIQNK